MDIDQLLTTTRSARKTLDLDRAVDLADVRDCLRIGLQAPNGSNSQSWRWLVVADPERRAAIAAIYRQVRHSLTAGRDPRAAVDPESDMGRMLASTEWLVEHLHEVPLLVIPCYQPYMPRGDDDESFYLATVYGSIFPAVWNFQLALHSRGYGTCITTLHLYRASEVRALLGIPDTYVQGCLLPVARLRPGTSFTPAPRKPIDDVVALDHWEGSSL